MRKFLVLGLEGSEEESSSSSVWNGGEREEGGDVSLFSFLFVCEVKCVQ